MKRYTPIFTEMSFPKKKITQEMIHHFYTINEHIVKLLLFPDEKHIHNEWKQSLRKTIGKIGRMKNRSNSYLKVKDYYNGFFVQPYERGDNYKFLDEIVEDVLFENNDLRTPHGYNNYPKEVWIEKIKSFFHDVSELISSGQYSHTALNELIDKYFEK